MRLDTSTFWTPNNNIGLNIITFISSKINWGNWGAVKKKSDLSVSLLTKNI